MHRERSLSGYLRTLANALVQELGQGLDTLGLTPAQGMFLHRIWYCREVLGQGLCAKDLSSSSTSGTLRCRAFCSGWRRQAF